MKQLGVGDAEHAGRQKKSRREPFPDEMERVVPRKTLLRLIEPGYPTEGNGRPPIGRARSRYALPATLHAARPLPPMLPLAQRPRLESGDRTR
jgi:hypothetical protein